MSYNRTEKASTTLSVTEAYLLDRACDRLNVSRSEYVRELILLSLGMPDSRTLIVKQLKSKIRPPLAAHVDLTKDPNNE